MPIRKLSKQSRVTEVVAALSKIEENYVESGLQESLHLPSIMDRVIPLSQRLAAAVNSDKAESTLDERDENRDSLYRSFGYSIMGFTHNPAKAIREAAVTVSAVFDKYGFSIVTESYDIETGLLKSMLADLKEATVAAALEKLPGMVQLVEQLSAAETAFEKAAAEWEQLKSEDKSSSSATDIKKEILPLINDKLVAFLNGIVVVDEATYGGFANTVAQIIQTNNSAVNKRSAN